MFETGSGVIFAAGVPMNLELEDRKGALTTALSDLQQHQPLK